jgi:hypothetical protein
MEGEKDEIRNPNDETTAEAGRPHSLPQITADAHKKAGLMTQPGFGVNRDLKP